MTWSVTGTPAEASNYCEGCDIGMLTEAFVDRANTTCEESVYFSYQSYTYLYDVRLRDGGSADWYYYGYPMGAGYWAGEEVTDMNYLSAAACVYFN
ncbi:MAG: hypothetical protein ACOZNI_34185 [Myxococcota bacterium]